MAKRKKYNDLIQKISIANTPNTAGIYPGSMIWQFYIKRVKYFRHLK